MLGPSNKIADKVRTYAAIYIESNDACGGLGLRPAKCGKTEEPALCNFCILTCLPGRKTGLLPSLVWVAREICLTHSSYSQCIWRIHGGSITSATIPRQFPCLLLVHMLLSEAFVADCDVALLQGRHHSQGHAVVLATG